MHRRRAMAMWRTAALAACVALVAAACSDGGDGQAGEPEDTAAGEEVPSITILQPQTPWLPSFETLVEAYETDTGNQVELSLTPFDGMVQRSLNSVQAGESDFDVLLLNSQWFTQFYAEGHVTSLAEIDPDFALDPEILEYEYSTRWNPETRRSDANGEVYGLPINGNVQLLYYRTDLYQEAGLSCPETWQDLESNAEALHAPPDLYGFAVRTNPPIFDFLSRLLSVGGDIMTYDEQADAWTVTIAEELAVDTLNEWLRVGQTYGPSNFASLSQPDLISLMGSGQLAQVGLVAAAAGDFQDEDKSAMAGNIGACPVPGGTPDVHGAVAGIWLMGIPDNLPDDRKQAALAFMEYATSRDPQVEMTRAGGIPTRRDVYESLADDPDVGWWVSATLESIDSLLTQPSVISGAQLVEAVNVRVGQVVAGEMEPQEALESAAQEITAGLESAGYTVTGGS